MERSTLCAWRERIRTLNMIVRWDSCPDLNSTSWEDKDLTIDWDTFLLIHMMKECWTICMELCQMQTCMKFTRQNIWIASITLCARTIMATHSNGLQIISKRQERLWHCFCDCGLIQQETYQHAMLQDNRSRRYGMIICGEYLPPMRTTTNPCVRQRSTVHLCI